MAITKILGLIKAIHSSSTPPTNTQMIWYDTNVSLHKYYKIATATWTLLSSSAVTLAQTLVNGAITGGNSISFTDGDYMDAVNGTGKLNLRDGFDGFVTLSGAVVRISGSTSAALTAGRTLIISTVSEASIEGKTGIDFIFNAVSKMYVNINGLGIGTNVQDSMLEVKKTTTPIQTAAPFKLKGGIDFTMGVSPTYAWMSTWGGHMSIDTNSQGVTFGSVNSPTAADANNKLLLESGSTTRMTIKKGAIGDDATIDFYAAGSLSARLGSGVGGLFAVINTVANQDITFITSAAHFLLTLDATNRSVKIGENLSVAPNLSAGNPSNPLDMENITIVEQDTIVATSTTVDDIDGEFDGKIIYIVNVGEGSIVLSHVGGTIGTWIRCPLSADYTIAPKETIQLYYSADKSSWIFLQSI